MVYVMQYLFYGIPIAAVLFFLISLGRYFDGKDKKITAEKMRLRKQLLVISSIIFGVLAAVVIAIIVLLYTAVAFM